MVLVERTTLLDLPDWTGVVTAVDGPTGTDQEHDPHVHHVEFDRDLPSGLEPDRFVAENITYCARVSVRNNRIETLPTPGVLLGVARP